jgi:hypothetical protein
VAPDDKETRAVFLSEQLAPVKHVPLVERPSDRTWRTAAVRRLKERGVRQNELAQHVGASPPQITYLLTGRKIDPSKSRAPATPRRQRLSRETGEQEIVRSAFVERISIALGIDLPVTAELEAALGELDPLDLEQLRGNIRLALIRRRSEKR